MSANFQNFVLMKSKHESAEFHGAARALSGGGVYVR
jgi:hypothetical protein